MTLYFPEFTYHKGAGRVASGVTGFDINKTRVYRRGSDVLVGSVHQSAGFWYYRVGEKGSLGGPEPSRTAAIIALVRSAGVSA